MSKSKMKNKVVSKNRPQQNTNKKDARKKKVKKPWIKPKDFQFLKPIKWLPGFRTAKHWKRILAMLYFCTIPFSLVLKFGEFMYFGIFVFFMLLAAPFLIMPLITFVETKEKYYAIEAAVAMAVIGIDNMLLTYFMQEFMKTLG